MDSGDDWGSAIGVGLAAGIAALAVTSFFLDWPSAAAGLGSIAFGFLIGYIAYAFANS
jgi:hypothetical protein